jgi:hypothetical protein
MNWDKGMSIKDMRRHILALCKRHGIAVGYSRHEAYATTRYRDKIVIYPIKSEVAYSIALHEIGHILGRHQTSLRVLVKEEWAWRWARKHAIVWTQAMERDRLDSMAYYTLCADVEDRNYLVGLRKLAARVGPPTRGEHRHLVRVSL